MHSQDPASVFRSRKAPKVVGFALALPLVALATLLASIADQSISVPNVSLIFVLPVVLLAVWFGWGPALLAAGAGVLCYNFFLIEPRYTLRVADAGNAWALALFVVVAAVVSAVAAQSRRRSVEALEHAEQSAALLAMVRALVAARDRAAIMQAAADTLGRMFAAPAIALLSCNEEIVEERSTDGAAVSAADREAARWALSSKLATRAGAYPVDATAFDFWPVQAASPLRAVLGVRFGEGRGGRPADPERLVGIVAGQLAVALDRDLYAREAAAAQIGRERERIKADLLAAVSHDLKTPLSTILFTLQSLQRFGDSHDPATRQELLGAAELETARLGGLVNNLLDMGRLDADAVSVRPAVVELADLVASALVRAQAATAGRTILNGAATSHSLVTVDYTLAETALAAVLENAGKYASPGAPIEIRCFESAGAAEIEVLDQGAGFPIPVEPLFEKFTRGADGDGRPPGTGLGLAIARGFLEAQGGAIRAANRDDRLGGRVTISLPLASPATTAEPRSDRGAAS